MSRSSAEILLAAQLDQARISYHPEFHFAITLGRKWRADFAFIGRIGGSWRRILVEVDGGSWVAGRHVRGKGFEADLEKLNAAALIGFRVLRFTPAMVEDGRALAVIRQALGLEQGAVAS